MEKIIELAKQAHKEHGFAVAALVVKENEVIAHGFTSVRKEKDPTAHAEISSIRNACKKLDSTKLEGCYLYTTYEPCPMCISAAIWARMKGVVWGASREDSTATHPWRIKIPATDVINKGTPLLEFHSEFMREECKVLLSF